MFKISFLTRAGMILLAGLIIWWQAPRPAEAKLTCTRLVTTPRGEQLVNTCGSCRLVHVQRKRPGADAPINRTLTLAPRTTTDLSFRGPGHSRIIADTPCHQGAGAEGGATTEAQQGPQEDNKRCILMQRTVNAGVSGLALANTCNECRTAVVDRVDAQGRRRSQNIAIGGRSIMPLPAKGAVQAGILHEKPCK